MSNETDFNIDDWDEFVNNFAKLVDKWAEKKAVLLKKMATIYMQEVKPLVPVDTSRLVDSISFFGEGIPRDYVEVGTDVEYALYVNDGHIQHSGNANIRIGGKTKAVMLDEKYIKGVFFFENARTASIPRWRTATESFMKQIAREVEGGKL